MTSSDTQAHPSGQASIPTAMTIALRNRLTPGAAALGRRWLKDLPSDLTSRDLTSRDLTSRDLDLACSD